MKKSVKVIIIVLGIGLLLVIYNKFYDNTDYGIIEENFEIQHKLMYKGLKDARDFTTDGKGNYYIAYEHRIQYVQKNGKSYDVLNDKKLDINSIEYKNGIYFVSSNSVFYFDVHNKVLKEIINDLPNFGDHNLSLIKIYENNLYITIGSATNSGVVGKDNNWLKYNTYNCDITPFDITIKGKNFGEEKTGAFVPYKTKNINGQVIPSHFPGNASIIKYSLIDGNIQNYAWGIRNVKGLDFSSDGKLFASIGGMEDRGLRPVKGDSDYLFEIKKNIWYGWPDYSGGDPLNSPKFKSNTNERISFVLDKHPTTNPPAPLYQHKYLNSLESVAVDSLGSLGEKDNIYFYDSKNNTINKLNKKNIIKPVLKFNNNLNIKSIKFGENGMILLDSKQGYLYNFYMKFQENNMINKNIYYCLIAVVLGSIIAIIRIKG